MRILIRSLTLAVLAAAASLTTAAQTPSSQPAPSLLSGPSQGNAPGLIAPLPLEPASDPVGQSAPAAEPSLPVTPAMQMLLSFKDSDVKFAVSDLMDILRDRRHEGWVLAAYPDPKTSHPLIGAGFSLDLPARDHLQTDPLNPNPFIEPSSEDLWRAAGLDDARLNAILGRFSERMAQWKKKGFRRRMLELEPDISSTDADLLLRIAIIQSIDNAKAYCRNFDALTGPQQMALSQLVYQIGFNLQHFSQFLSQVNADAAAEAGYWRSVQTTLEQSKWARLYRIRATAVIAMLDPTYADDPAAAEKRVAVVLHPAVAHHRHGRAQVRTQLASTEQTPRPAHRHARRSKSLHSHARQAA